VVASAQREVRKAQALVLHLARQQEALFVAFRETQAVVQAAQAAAERAKADGRSREDIARAQHAAQAAWRDLDQVRKDLRLIAGDVAPPSA
jgi:hypothetical protein